ncbi:glycosyltransferase family 1 protein [Nocardioides conyzicola]|uniref:Glycosyl transferase family 1 domain-containing protein n=1 Tax=Nocardioides conyzicola TaxID=1651781 RepID=A0ABP8XL04_9ACTN
MRLLLEAHWWVDGPPSGRNVLRTIVEEWARRHPEDLLTIRVPRTHVLAVADELRSAGVMVEALSVPSRIQAISALTTRARSDRFDAVLTQNFGALAGDAARAVLVYDALFVSHPAWFKRWERLYLSMIRPSLRHSDVIFTISESENVRVGQVWPEVRERCVPVGLGVPRGLSEATPQAPALPIGAGIPFVLSVGRLNVRKNLARLIQAFEGMATDADRHHLLIVGQPDGAVEDLGLPASVQDRVHFLGFVDDSELRWLYQNAALFVCPSLDEGLGLPILEAANEGTKVAASDIPVFRELGIASAYFDPRDVDSIRLAILTGLAAPVPGVSELPYTWERTIETMREAIKQLLADPRRKS